MAETYTIPNDYKTEAGLIEAVALDNNIFGDDICHEFRKHIRLYCDTSISLSSRSTYGYSAKSVVEYHIEYAIHPVLISEDERFIHLIFFNEVGRMYDKAFNSVASQRSININMFDNFRTEDALTFIDRIYAYRRHLYFTGNRYHKSKIPSFMFNAKDITNSLGLIDIDGKQVMIYYISTDLKKFYGEFPNDIFNPDITTHEAAVRLCKDYTLGSMGGMGIESRCIVPIRHIMDSVLGNEDYTSDLTSIDIASIFFCALQKSKYEMYSSLYSVLLDGVREGNTKEIPKSAGMALRRAIKRNRPPTPEKKRKKRGKIIRKAAGTDQESDSRASC